jgi:endonuclease/exonuclease/phosphatase (EEP) superfamily protein YafD
VPTVPAIRIDHIFYSDHFFASGAYTVDNSGGSDHFPVIAELLRIKE